MQIELTPDQLQWLTEGLTSYLNTLYDYAHDYPEETVVAIPVVESILELARKEQSA